MCRYPASSAQRTARSHPAPSETCHTPNPSTGITVPSAKVRCSSGVTVPPSAEHDLRGLAEQRLVALDQKRRHERVLPRFEIMADLVRGSEQGHLLDQIGGDPGGRLVLL